MLLLAALTLSVLPSSASGDEPVFIKSFAKNGLSGATIVFRADDFTGNTVGSGTLSEALVVSLPSGGSLVCSGRAVAVGQTLSADELAALEYVPADGSTVCTSFELAPVFAGGKHCDTACGITSVSLNLAPELNSPPVVADIGLKTYKNMSIPVYLAGADPDGEQLTYTIVSVPSQGTLTESDGVLVYTPKADRSGKVSFTYYATDTHGASSALASVSIKVSGKADFEYADLSGSLCAYDAVRLAEEGVFVGERCGESYVFSGETELTRGEFVAMTLAASGRSCKVNASSVDGAMWHSAAITTALEDGLITSARAEDNISVAEAAVVLARLLDADVSGLASVPAASVPDWAYESVCELYSLGVLTDFELLDAPLTRAQAASMLSRAMQTLDGAVLGVR